MHWDGAGGTCVIISEQTSWASGQAGVWAGPTSAGTCTKYKPLRLGEEPSPDSTPSCHHLVQGPAWQGGRRHISAFKFRPRGQKVTELLKATDRILFGEGLAVRVHTATQHGSPKNSVGGIFVDMDIYYSCCPPGSVSC